MSLLGAHMRLDSLAYLAGALVALTACNFGDDDCEPAPYRDYAEPAFQLRNPDTGVCEAFGGGGGGGCDTCGNCYDAPTPPALERDWADCYGMCESLGESMCLATSGCRAAYIEG